MQRFIGVAVVAMICCVGSPTFAQKPPELIKKYRDWSVYKYQDSDKVICFAASQPSSRKPLNLKADRTYFYISAWPKESVKAEVSVRMGFSMKPNSAVTAQVDAKVFKLILHKDNAFVADPRDELKFIDAIKRGRRMVITGTSAKDEKTVDVYSLAGTTSALKQMAKVCG